MNTALAKTLLHFIWEGGGVALALAVALKVIRPASARVRYGTACVAMLAMLAAFAVTLIHFWPHADTLGPPTINFQLVPPIDDLPAEPPAPSPNSLWWLAPSWMLGATLFSLRSFASWLSAQRMRRIGVCAAPEHWQQRVRHLARRVRVSRPVILLESCLTEVPVVIGCLRPAILLPAGLLTGFPAEQVEYFLIHELAHIQRWDYLVNLLQTAAENLLFYHPAVWWVSSTIRAERENCCDDVVAALGDASEFATALAALEVGRGALVQPALAANGGNLTNRVRRLLGHPEPRSGATPSVLLFALAVAIGIAAAAPEKPSATPVVTPPLSVPAVGPVLQRPALLAQAQTKGQPNAPSPDGPAMPTAYQNWLNEEAVYIITDAERQAFRSLRTDEERQMFIQQFWLRRDPTPGTPENELRDEHYRRIAYANDRFAAGSIAGWKTDRGMIYIKFGPPDEKEIHPSEPPREIWLYRFIEGIGTNVKMEFVDPNGTGEYHMTMDPNEPAAPQPQGVVQQPNGPGGRGLAPASPSAKPLAASKPSPASVIVTPRDAGNIVAVYVADRQMVTAGQLLVELDLGRPPYNLIHSPIAGSVSVKALAAGQHVEAGQPLLTITSISAQPGDADVPISYLQAQARSLQFQAGYEGSYLHFHDVPAEKALQEASRDLERSMASSSLKAQSAFDRLRTAVENARSARNGSAPQPVLPAPWWASDPQDSAAMASAIEVSATIQPDGYAQDARVVRSSDPSLNRSAIEAIQGWRFPVTGMATYGNETYLIRVLVDPSKLARR
jgi:GWxTD domain-containing protein